MKSAINGPITFTPDANPLIGSAHGLQNGWLLTGSSIGVMEGGGAGRGRWLEAPGATLDIGLCGAYAANSMRLEKGYRGWGADLTTKRSPLEAGLSFLGKHDGRDFVGKDAMLAQSTPWDMVLLELDTMETDPFYSHTVLHRGDPVGIVTSGGFGHRTGKTLALDYLRDPTARNNLEVKILGTLRTARIPDHPPFDPGNARLTS